MALVCSTRLVQDETRPDILCELIIFKKIFFSHFEILERSKETVKSLYIRNLLYRNLFVQQSPINYLLQLHCLLIRMMI